MSRAARFALIGVGALIWVGATAVYAYWAYWQAFHYWASSPGASHNLWHLMFGTFPTSIIGFIPMYLFAAAAWNGGTATVAPAMGTWFAVTAVVNPLLIVGFIALVIRAVRSDRRRSKLPPPTAEALSANPYLT